VAGIGVRHSQGVQIYRIQQFWFNNHYYPGDGVERHFLDIKDFGTRNLAVTCALNVLGPGAHVEQHDSTLTGDLGVAAVGIKRYEFIDDHGQFQHVDNDYFWPCAIIRICVAVRIELSLHRTWAGATGTVHYFKD
jgi:hypothetical protein